MSEMDGLASNVRNARRRAGISQTDLAKAARVGSGTVARIETGGENPRVSTLYRLAEALGVSVHDLLPEQPPAETPDHRP